MMRRALQSGRGRKNRITGEWSGNIIYQTRRACVIITQDQDEPGTRHNTEPTIKPMKEETQNTVILEAEEIMKREEQRERQVRASKERAVPDNHRFTRL